MSNEFKQKFDLFVETYTVHGIKDLDWGCKVNDNTGLGKVGARASPWSFYDVIAQMPLWIISVSYALFHSCGFRVLGKGVQLANPRTHGQGLTSRCQKMKISGTMWLLSSWLLPILMHRSFHPKSGFFGAGLLKNKWQMLTLAIHLPDFSMDC